MLAIVTEAMSRLLRYDRSVVLRWHRVPTSRGSLARVCADSEWWNARKAKPLQEVVRYRLSLLAVMAGFAVERLWALGAT